MAAPKRQSPLDRVAARNVPAVDPNDNTMDPEMKATLGDEVNRVAKSKVMYAPGSVVKPTPAAKAAKKPGLIDIIKKKMGIQY